MSDLMKGTLTEADPVSEEEQLLEAKAWGFDTVEEFCVAMEEPFDEDLYAAQLFGLEGELTEFIVEFDDGLNGMGVRAYEGNSHEEAVQAFNHWVAKFGDGSGVCAVVLRTSEGEDLRYREIDEPTILLIKLFG